MDATRETPILTEPGDESSVTAVDEGSGSGGAGEASAMTTIGRYVVVGTLGEGGMGVVHAAYDPELDRKVALKVLLPNRSRRAKGHERLLREAQSLARLSHPNVVAVHDVGTHEGRVFVAMEFIAGATLRAKIAAERPGVAAIVRLYAAAGEGLAAAHRVGLVHRDFKPENVMVDREGRVRVVDFGIAQAVAEASADEATSSDTSLVSSLRLSRRSGPGPGEGLTVTGAMMGTPAYMAPEQFAGGQTDARTDVFAFCVALYEDLYGERPFAGETAVAVAAAVMRGKLRDPPRGSAVPRALHRVLLRGLARDPSERYPSMDALLADLSAAMAAPRRRRNAALVGAAALLLAGAGAAALMAKEDALARCREGAEAIVTVWSPAAREAGARAFGATGLAFADDAWARAAGHLDAWTAAWSSARAGVCDGELSEALRDRRIACFDRQRARVEGLVELLATADAKLVARSGEVIAGLPSPRECDAAALVDGDGPAAPSEAQAPAVEAFRRRLAAATTRFGATFGDAEADALDALVDEARALGYRPIVAESAKAAAEAHLHLSHHDRAEARFLDALREAEVAGDVRLLAAIMPKWMIFLVRARSAFAEARHAELRAEALVERIGGDEATLFELGQARVTLATGVGDAARVRSEGEATLALGERLFGAGSLKVADIHNNLGGHLIDVDHAAAREHVQRAFAIWERELGPDHPKIAYSYFNLARIAMNLDTYAEAERLYREALVRFERMDPNHVNIGAVYTNLGQVLDYLDEPARALEEYRRGLAHLRRTQGEEHAMTAQSYCIASGAELVGGHVEAARHDAEECLRIRRALLDEANPKVIEAEGRLLEALVAAGEVGEAGALADRMLAAIGEAPLERVSFALAPLVQALLADGRAAEALALGERGLAPDTGKGKTELRFQLARALVATGGDRTRARRLVEQAVAYWRLYPRYYAAVLRRADEVIAELDGGRSRSR